MDWPEDDDLWLLPAHLKESCAQTTKEDALKFLQAPPKVAFATQVALSKKLQRAIDKKAKKMTPSSARNSLVSLPSVDEVNEEDTPKPVKSREDIRETPTSSTTLCYQSSVHSSPEEQSGMGAETDEMDHGIQRHENNLYFDEDEEFLLHERSILEEEMHNSQSEHSTRSTRVSFSEPKILELEFETHPVQNVLPSPSLPEISSDIRTNDITLSDDDFNTANSSQSMEQARSLTEFRSSPQFDEMYYHPEKLDRNASPPRMVDFEESSSDEEFYDAEDDVGELNNALIESMEDMTLSSSHLDDLQSSKCHDQPIARNPSLSKVIEEPPENRGLLGNRTPRNDHIDLDPMTPKVHQQRSNSVSPRQNISDEHSTVAHIKKNPVASVQDRQMSISVHSSLSSTPVTREGRTMRVQGKNPPLSARMPSAPPPRQNVLKSQLSVNTTPNIVGASIIASKSANVSPKMSIVGSSGNSATRPSLHVDLADLQALAKKQEEELRKAEIGDRALGERKHSWQSEGNVPSMARALHNSGSSSQQQISTSKSADISQLQRQSRAPSVSGTTRMRQPSATRLPPPRAALPASFKKSGILAPGFGNKKVTLGTLPTRPVSAMSQSRHVVHDDDECF